MFLTEQQNRSYPKKMELTLSKKYFKNQLWGEKTVFWVSDSRKDLL